jgi:hypothetical protein
MNGYLHAWQSNDPAAIGALFAGDARYYTAPFREPWRGRDEIVREWLDRKDDPGTWTFDWDIVAIADDLGIVQGATRYPTGAFSNLWLIRLDATGECTEFTEWWMSWPKTGD